MKNIVVGLDTSPRAGAVLRAALELAERSDARLTVIRAVGLPVELPPEALSINPDALPARLQAATQGGLERAVSLVPPQRLGLVEARIGTPWQVICDAAREVHADLVVVGTHGHSALDRLLGTTAARVVNHAPCSVMVVREESAKK